MTTSTGFSGGAAPSGGQNYFSTEDWASIIKGAGQGAGEGMKASSQYGSTKRESKEDKRKTLANLLKKALQRDLAMYRADTGHQDEMSALQGNAMQQVAMGFADSLRGATTQGRSR